MTKEILLARSTCMIRLRRDLSAGITSKESHHGHAIERVELLADGASATYGSDAVAGVAHIILKKNFNGVLLNTLVRSKPDDYKNKIGLTFGITSADGTSNLMGHFGYSIRAGVLARPRTLGGRPDLVDHIGTSARHRV